MHNHRDPYDLTDRDDLSDFHDEMYHAIYEADGFDDDEHDTEEDEQDDEDDEDDEDDD